MSRIGSLMLAAMVAVCPLTAHAQSWFTANLTGTQEVPANASAGIGFARATLNATGTQISVSVHYSGLGANVTAGHVHGPAPVGVNAGVLFNLSPTTGVNAGSVVNASFAVTPAQVADLRAGLHYVNIHTTGFPGGEIRGQLLPDSPITARLNGAQEVPANAATGTGFGVVSINVATNQALATLSWSELGGAATGGHIHAAAVGVNGAVVCNLNPPAAASGSLVDSLCTFTGAQITALQTGNMYFNLHTPSFPGGEIRGQIAGVFANGFE